MTDPSNNNVAELFAPGPGERLRAARLSMNYDLAKIASELHLTTAVVQALEADDYDGVGVRVFVRGYLRNYARVVGMAEESILRQFDEKWPDEGLRHSMLKASPRLPADGSPSRGLAGAMTWLLLLGVVVLFLMWWRGYLDELVPAPAVSESTVEEEVTAEPVLDEWVPATPTSDDQDLVLADGSLRLPSPLASADGESGAEPPQSAAGAFDDMSNASSPLALDLATQRPASTEVTEAADIEALNQAPARSPEPLISPALAAAAPALVATATIETPADAAIMDDSKRIVMTFSAPCWVDVRDNAREFKLFGEMPNGATKVLGGQPPYKMVIGNSRAVTITINGEPFDLTPYAKGNVARFTLDP
ncbi:MAG: DUF4115 domain-containing protein [Chromatiaceae bacterium]|jgi:cytoskeleton protein RodZ